MDFIINYWIEAIFGIILAFLGWGFRRINKKVTEDLMKQDAIETAMLAILHDRLFQGCRHWIELGYIPTNRAEEVLNNIDMLYNAYHTLGGNGAGTIIYNTTKALPLRAEDGK